MESKLSEIYSIILDNLFEHATRNYYDYDYYYYDYYDDN